MAQIIDARVKQKVDTLAGWMANPLVILEGEQCFVGDDSDPNNNSIAFKIGDGQRTFSQLPWPDYTVRGRVTPGAWGSRPSGVYIPVSDGSYGSQEVTLSDGYQVLHWDGSVLVKVVYPIDLAGYTTQADFLAVEDVVSNKFGTEMIVRSSISSGEWSMGGPNKNTTNNWISTDKFSVSPSTEYTLSGGGESSGVVLFDGSGNPTRRIAGGNTSPLTFTTDSGESLIGVNVVAEVGVGSNPPNSPYYHSISLVAGEIIKFDVPGDKIVGNITTQQIQQIESEVSELGSFMDSFIDYIEQSASFTDGRLNINGATGNTSGWRRTSITNGNVMYQVTSDGKTFAYTGEIASVSGTAAAGVCFYDSGLNFIGYAITDIAVHDRVTFSPPAGTRYMGACSYGSNPLIEEVAIRIKSSMLPTSAGVIHVNGSASPGGDGTASAPFQTISEGMLAMSSGLGNVVMVYQGDYRETIDFGVLPSGDFYLTNKEGHTVRQFGSNSIAGWVKTSGRTNVYDAAFPGTIPNWSRYENPIFEDGRPSKPIDPDEYHPLQKNLQYMLPFTPIIAVGSISDVDSTPGSYYVTGGRIYLHTSGSDNPSTSGYSYEVPVRAANTVINPVTTDKKVNLNIKGIQFYYNTTGVRLRGFNDSKLQFVTSMATPGPGAICPGTGNNEFYYCEAAFCNGDGFNGHFSDYPGYENLSDNRSNYPTTRYIGCWSHDNFDDGESSHEQHNVFMDACLLEQNGDSGCRPSNDSTYYVKDSVFRNNGWEVGHGGSAGKGEGFAVVNPAINPERLGVRAILFNCVSYGNNTGYGTISNDNNKIELINCTSRDNTTAEYYAGQGEMVLRNCKATNADPAKIKVTGTGTITVLNDTEVV